MTELPLEYQVFALSMQQEGAIDYFSEHLPVDAVKSSGKGYADLYVAMLDFHSKTGVSLVDEVAFRSWLEHETVIHDALGGAEGVDNYLKDVMTVPLSTPQAVTNILRFRRNKATQTERSAELVDLVEKRDRSEESVDAINSIVEEIRLLNSSAKDPLETVDDGMKIADRAESLWDLPDFIPTPFKSLNRAMGYDSDNAGFCKGAVHAVLAASGRGKSSLVKTLMNHWVEKDHTVLFVNYEEAIAHWERILFTQITKQNVYKAARLTDSEREHYTKIFQETMRRWDGRFIVKHDPETPYFEDIEAWIREVVHRRGSSPDVIILDTIQSMFLKGNGGKLPRWGQYEEMMVRLEKLAKELNSAIIITAQENSNRMKEKREVVQQSDIGGSLAIAQKSTIAIFITEAKSSTGDDSTDEYVMQLQIPKNRITGQTFAMDAPLVKYNDETKSYEPYDLVDRGPYDPDVVLSEIIDDGEFH